MDMPRRRVAATPRLRTFPGGESRRRRGHFRRRLETAGPTSAKAVEDVSASRLPAAAALALAAPAGASLSFTCGEGSQRARFSSVAARAVQRRKNALRLSEFWPRPLPPASDDPGRPRGRRANGPSSPIAPADARERGRSRRRPRGGSSRPESPPGGRASAPRRDASEVDLSQGGLDRARRLFTLRLVVGAAAAQESERVIVVVEELCLGGHCSDAAFGRCPQP